MLTRYHPLTDARRAVLARMVMLAAAEKRARTHCPAGHEYAGSNLYVRLDGRRMCRECRRQQALLCAARRRAREAGHGDPRPDPRSHPEYWTE